MHKKIIALVACMMLLTSCGNFSTDIESLLYPPTLNTQQSEVYAALGETMNTSLIEYVYPQRGSYRSPFVFYDIDGDEKDEAVVFYIYTSDPSDIRAKFMRQGENGKWESFYDVSSGYGGVDFISFSHLLSSDCSSVVIGWKDADVKSGIVQNSIITAYSLMDGAFSIEISAQPYIEYKIHDFDDDGLDELVTIQRSEDQTLHLSLTRAIGRHLDVVDSIPLNNDSDSILGLVIGKLSSGKDALYIDELRIDTIVATEVIAVNTRGINLLSGGQPPAPEELEPIPAWENYTFTFRDDPALLSRDVDKNGTVEVPAPPVALAGNLYEGQENPLMLTQLLNLNAQNSFVIWENTVINQQEDYVVVIPDKWTDTVSVIQDNEIGEWRFYLIDIQTGNVATELLQIKAMEAQIGEGTQTDMILLGNRGNRYYYGYIPLPAADVPSITETELKKMFYLQ